MFLSEFFPIKTFKKPAHSSYVKTDSQCSERGFFHGSEGDWANKIVRTPARRLHWEFTLKIKVLCTIFHTSYLSHKLYKASSIWSHARGCEIIVSKHNNINTHKINLLNMKIYKNSTWSNPLANKTNVKYFQLPYSGTLLDGARVEVVWAKPADKSYMRYVKNAQKLQGTNLPHAATVHQSIIAAANKLYAVANNPAYQNGQV